MSRPLFPLVLLLACGDKETVDSPGVDDSSPADDSSGDDSATEGCQEDGAGELPEGAEWLVLDGVSDTTFSFKDGNFSSAWQGNYGTYDLNTEEVYGANGFRLERPAQVVAVELQWVNLTDEVLPVVATIWPDFGSDGYVWDIENPTVQVTRCLNGAHEGEWARYVLPEPFRVEQPVHVFAGYHRAALADAPELLMEDNLVGAEPFHAGARYPDVDEQLFYLGAAFNFYTWRVRLAVVYDEAIDPLTKPFQIDEALTASSRVAWGDYDNDGDDDLMSNGPTLYRNEGDGSFTNVTSQAFTASAGTNGGVWGDYDNDGWLDYFGQGGGVVSGEVLLRNLGDGTFEDVTVHAGIHDLQSERDCDGDGAEERSPTEGSAWFDLDNDGWLDLYLANYECSSEHDFYENYDDFVWRNNGDGSFSDWTALAVGVPSNNQAGRGVSSADYDLDGDIDVFVSNYRLDPNFFLENLGDGTVDNVARENGTRGLYTQGAYGHTIGAAFGDIDNDGDVDMVHANLAHPFYYHFSDSTQVLINDGSGRFTDEAPQRGIYYRETHSNPTLFDADNDGDLDLFITAVYAGRDSDFYENDGAGVFTLRNHESGLVRQNGWGSAAADYDNDGDVDLVAYALHRNDSDNDNHWLQVRAVGGAGQSGRSNVAAIGAAVQVRSGELDQLRLVSGGSGTGVQDSLTQHFGLGDQSVADQVTVSFPGGAQVTVEAVAAGQRLWVHEDGRSATGWAPPSW